MPCYLTGQHFQSFVNFSLPKGFLPFFFFIFFFFFLKLLISLEGYEIAFNVDKIYTN